MNVISKLLIRAQKVRSSQVVAEISRGKVFSLQRWKWKSSPGLVRPSSLWKKKVGAWTCACHSWRRDQGELLSCLSPVCKRPPLSGNRWTTEGWKGTAGSEAWGSELQLGILLWQAFKSCRGCGKVHMFNVFVDAELSRGWVSEMSIILMVNIEWGHDASPRACLVSCPISLN